MLVVAALYAAHWLVFATTGQGLPPVALLALCLPGVVAAHICAVRGMDAATEKEGALAGVVTACLAAPLQVIVLVWGVLNTDWARYAAQAGPDVAAAVRAAALPATILLAVVAVAITYAGCTVAALLGALTYSGVRRVITRESEAKGAKD